MFILIRKALLLAFGLFLLSGFSHAQNTLSLSNEQLERIGQRVYKNETGGNEAYLIAWNQGESFASLGIGHFIWFPQDLHSPFTESFPALLSFMEQHQQTLPNWLTPQLDCPWKTKAEFEQAKNSEKMQSLRVFLKNTLVLQTQFIHQRMQLSLPKILASLEQSPQRSTSIRPQKNEITELFYQLASSEAGSYALIDYVNFKGEGTSPKERYKGEGWGLLQVLDNMDDSSAYDKSAFAKSDNEKDSERNSKTTILAAFGESCKQVLTNRVKNSPQQDVEKRWLKGWINRCSTYG